MTKGKTQSIQKIAELKEMLGKEKASNNNKVTKLEQDLNKAKEKVSQCVKDMQKEREGHIKRVNKLEQDLSKEKTKSSSFEKSMNKTLQEKRELEDKLQAEKKRASKLDDQLKSKKEFEAELQEKLRSEREEAFLENELNKKKIEANEESRRNHESEIRALEGRIRVLKEQGFDKFCTEAVAVEENAELKAEVEELTKLKRWQEWWLQSVNSDVEKLRDKSKKDDETIKRFANSDYGKLKQKHELLLSEYRNLEENFMKALMIRDAERKGRRRK